VIKGIREWIWAWRRRGWKTAEGNDVLNRELWEKLSHFVQERGTKGIDWHYVRGHIGIPGNERVDEIATAYALQDDPGPTKDRWVSIRTTCSRFRTSVPQRSG
jgi:ribonuclease HI